MKLTAPIGIVASLRDDGVLYPDGWPPRSPAGADGRTAELAVTLEGTVADRVDVIPLPRIADVLAEAIEGWWGSHGWSYPGRELILHIDRAGRAVNGWPIAQLSALLERSCPEFGGGSWTWVDDAAREVLGLRWKAGGTEIECVPGKPLRVSYPSPATSGAARRCVAREREEQVLLIDLQDDPENVLVWLRYPSDVGATANELLAGATPSGALPRRLSVPRDRRSS